MTKPPLLSDGLSSSSSSSSSLSRSGKDKDEDNDDKRNGVVGVDGGIGASVVSWQCTECTFAHCHEEQQLFLACQMCGSARKTSKSVTTGSTLSRSSVPKNNSTATKFAPQRTTFQSNRKSPTATAASLMQIATTETKKTCQVDTIGQKEQLSVPSQPPFNNNNNKRSAATWGSLRPPTARDIRGKRRHRKALDAPPRCFDYLLVLDFEWTADNTRQQAMQPAPEITQFPTVVLQLVEKTKGQDMKVPAVRGCYNIGGVPMDLTQASVQPFVLRRDAFCIAAFDTFVRPTWNPTLTDFSIQLTGITQAQVDAAPTIDVALNQYMEWLQSLDLVNTDDDTGSRRGHWCFVTWGGW